MTRLLLAIALFGCNEYEFSALGDLNVDESTTEATLGSDDEAATGAIAGRFCDAGAPQVGAQVYVAVDEVVLSTSTDDDGRFLLAGVPAGEVLLNVVTADGSLQAQIPVLVEAGQLTDLPQYECPPADGSGTPTDPGDSTDPGEPTQPPFAERSPSDGTFDLGTPQTQPGDSGEPIVPDEQVPQDTGSPQVDTGAPDPDAPEADAPEPDAPQADAPEPDAPQGDTGSPQGDTGAPLDFDSPVGDTGDTAAPSGEDLCRTIGYWKNHPEDWPVTEIVVGSETLSLGEAVSLLGTEPNGDASLILGRQLIAAKLNLLIGAPTDIEPVVADADAWLVTWNPGTGLGFNILTSSPEGAEAVLLAQELDAYNNGTCW